MADKTLPQSGTTPGCSLHHITIDELDVLASVRSRFRAVVNLTRYAQDNEDDGLYWLLDPIFEDFEGVYKSVSDRASDAASQREAARAAVS